MLNKENFCSTTNYFCFNNMKEIASFEDKNSCRFLGYISLYNIIILINSSRDYSGNNYSKTN